MTRHIALCVVLLLFSAALLPGCTTLREADPEPVIETVEVKVPVDDPACVRRAIADLGAEPAYPDSDAALAAAPGLYQRVQLLLAGRVLRIVRGLAKSRALAACS